MMCMDLKRLSRYYYLSFWGYLCAGAVFCILLLIILISSTAVISEMISFVLAVLFWVCFLFGSVFVAIGGIKERQIYKQTKEEKDTELYKRHLLAGAFSFFSNKRAKAADILFITSLIISVILYRMHVNLSWLILVLTIIVTISFIFHSFWNGKIYMCINYFENESKSKE